MTNFTNPYLDLTTRFNAGKTRAIICSGQAVVLHGLAVMSKDGDWILREDEASLRHVLEVLDECGASYRFGAPLELPWLRMGWSSHFEFRHPNSQMRLRTDFFTRPPRISLSQLEDLWAGVEKKETKFPVTDLINLARLKQTNRERDFSVIGEIARQLSCPLEQMTWSRSARDLIGLAAKHPEVAQALLEKRALITFAIEANRDELEVALDKERRQLMRVNEARLEAMQSLMVEWGSAWPALKEQLKGIGLLDAHEIMVETARGLLPSS